MNDLRTYKKFKRQYAFDRHNKYIKEEGQSPELNSYIYREVLTKTPNQSNG